MQGVVHTGLLFLHFRFRSGTHVDDGHAAGQLGQAFLEFFAVVVGRGVLDLAANLGNAGFNIGRFAGTFHDNGFIFGNNHALGLAEVFDAHVFQLDAQVFRDALAAGKDGDVFHHGLAAVAEAGSLDRADVQHAAQTVDYQGGEGFAFNVFRNYKEGPAALGHFFKQRKEVLQVVDFLFVDEDVGVFQHRFHRFRVRHEVGRQISLVKLHAFHHVQRSFNALGFFHGDGAVLAHLVHGFRDDVADFSVPVGGDGSDLGHFLAGVDRLADLLEFFHNGIRSLHDAPLEGDGVSPGSNVAQAFAVNAFSQHGSGSGAVAGHVIGFGRYFPDKLGSHVFKRVFQFNFLGHGYAVLGDEGGTEFFVNHYVAAGRAQRALDSLGNLFHAAEQSLAGGFVKLDLFSHNVKYLK